MTDVELHPIAAELAAAMVRSPAGLSLPTAAVEKAEAKLRATSDPRAVEHLVALAVRTQRIAGDAGLAVNIVLALLVAEKLGSATAARDKFAAGGHPDAAALLGKAAEARAPVDASKPAAPPVKAKRGLR